MSQQLLPLLRDAWIHLDTKAMPFDQLKASDSMSLELLRGITSARRHSCGKAKADIDQGLAQHEKFFVQYLSYLSLFLGDTGPVESMTSQWTSPLGGTGTKMYKLTSLHHETGLATFQYAAYFMELGYNDLADAYNGPQESPEFKMNKAQEAIANLRKAAGTSNRICLRAADFLWGSAF